MNRIAAPVIALSLLAACTSAQIERAQGYQDKIASMCRVAVMLSPIAGPYAPWIVGACGTEAAIAKLALDSSSLEWIEGLIAKVRAR